MNTRSGAGGSSTPREEPDDGSPVSLDLQPGEFPRVVFRRLPRHRFDETWQQRSVRTPPAVPGRRSGRLAYFNNSKTMANSNVLQTILRDHGYERVEEKYDDWSVFWCAGQVEPSDLCLFQPHQKINKFPRASALTLKSNLWSCFARMLHKHGSQHFGFMPQTFVLPGQLEMYEDFMRTRLTEPGGERDVWILKPAAAYCGRGIFLHRPGDMEDDGDDFVPDNVRDHRGVACRYIDPPMLFGGLKSDIRLYVLVSSVHPLTIYLYEEGLARFATEPYDTSSLDRRCMHLTNYSLNKHSRNFVRNTNEEEDGRGSKWSLSAFKRRLLEEIGEQRSAAVWRQVDDMVVKAVIAAEPTLFESLRANVPAASRGEPNRQCFQVFGFDVMLDAHAKPWLLEVNLDPALRTESPLDLKIKSSMLIDLLNVVGMPLPPAPETPIPAGAGSVPPGAAAGSEAGGSSSSADAAAGAGAGAASSVDVSDVAAAASGAGADADNADVSSLVAEPDTAPPPDAEEAAAAWKARRDADRKWGEAARKLSPEAAAAAATAAAAAAFSSAASPRENLGLTDLELWHLALANAELERSKGGRWRRLLPSARSPDYLPFLDPGRTHNWLPFDC